MELIERYIYAVTQKLPAHQREDIEKELRGLIEDMLDERVPEGNAGTHDVEQVLLALGNPKELAKNYRGTERYLIGPDLFAAYLNVLIVVSASIGIAITVLFALEAIVNPARALELFADSLVDFLLAIFQGFTWVTIIFACLEYAGIRPGKSGTRDRAWKPSDLPALPDHRTRIPRSNPVAGIVFHVLIAMLFGFASGKLGVWRFHDGGQVVIPVFDEAVLLGFLPFILAVIAVGVVKDCVAFVTRRWTMALVGLELLSTAAGFVLALVMFADSAIWNPDFLEQLVQSGAVSADSEAFRIISDGWAALQDNLIYAIGLVFAIQVIVLAVKAYRLKASR